MIGISKCLIGDNCTYRGDSNFNELVSKITQKYEYIGICPEQLGGLDTPRDPAEIISENPLTIKTIKGVDVTNEFILGAKNALEILKENDIKIVILKANSPSCGVNSIYDGTFSGTKVLKDGVCARLLKENGIKLYTENNIKELEELLWGTF